MFLFPTNIHCTDAATWSPKVSKLPVFMLLAYHQACAWKSLLGLTGHSSPRCSHQSRKPTNQQAMLMIFSSWSHLLRKSFAKCLKGGDLQTNIQHIQPSPIANDLFILYVHNKTKKNEKSTTRYMFLQNDLHETVDKKTLNYLYPHPLLLWIVGTKIQTPPLRPGIFHSEVAGEAIGFFLPRPNPMRGRLVPGKRLLVGL